MVSNVGGMSTAFSKMPSASVYFISKIMQGTKVHLCWWLAHNLKVISNTPSRNLTLCHIIGKLILGNFEFSSPAAMQVDDKCPPPFIMDIKCLKRAGVIRVIDGKYEFYSQGETPKDVKAELEPSTSKGLKLIEKRLKKLENLSEKFEKLEYLSKKLDKLANLVISSRQS